MKMSKSNRLFKFGLDNIIIFQKPGNVQLLRNKSAVLFKELVRYENTVSPLRQAKKNEVGIGAYLLFLVPAATFGLGTWQVKRLKWKEGLIETLKSKTSAPPIEFPEDISELENLEFRRVVVRGRFDHSKELFYGPKPCLINGEEQTSDLISKKGEGSYGYLLVTPFILSNTGERILINRGWIKTKEKKPEKRLSTLVLGEQTIEGVVRHSEQKSKFMPNNNYRHRTWFCRDIDDMAEKSDTLPVYLDATEESSIPGVLTAGQTRITLRNEHFSYIITWYSLSLATGYMWYRHIFRR